MGSMSIWHWLVVGFLAMILFGRGRLSDVMADFAKGLKAFKKGMEDEPTQSESKDSLPKK